MRRVFVAAVALVALLVPATAPAKELRAAVICGSGSCVRVDDPKTLREIPQGGETEEPLGPPAAFFRLTFVHGVPPNTSSEPMYYLPRQNALAYVDRYGTVRALTIFGPSATNVMRRLTRGLTPVRPAPITTVRVGDRTLRGRDAAAYAQLFRAGTRTPVSYPGDWVPVDVRSAAPSPWTEGEREFMLAPAARILERGGVQYRLSDELASDVAAARPLGTSDESRPWPLLLAALGGGAIALALLAATARRVASRRVASVRTT